MSKPSETMKSLLENRTARILFVAVVSLSAYLNTLWNGFVWDDRLQVLGNRWIRDVSSIPDILTSGVWAFYGDKSSYYRPVMHLLYMLDYSMFGLAPWGYHLVNVLMNSAVCVMAYLAAERLVRGRSAEGPGGESFIPLATAVIFAVHPIHSEPVAWVAGAPDITYGFFFLLSFYLYMGSYRPDGRSSGPALIASASAFFASMLCKEPAVVLPAVLVSYDYTAGRLGDGVRGHIRRYAPYMAAIVLYFALRRAALGGFLTSGAQSMPLDVGSVLNAFTLFAWYLKKLVLPFNLSAYYEFSPAASVLEPGMLLAFAVTLVFIVSLVWLLAKRSLAAVGLALVALPLVPTLFSTDLIASAIADRYLYLPVMGFGIVLSMSFGRAASGFRGRSRILAAGLAVLAVLYFAGTVSRNCVWKDDYTLCRDTVKKAPNAAVFHAEYGIALADRGQIEQAEAEFNTAIRLADDDPSPHVNLATIYMQRGMLDRAQKECDAALVIDPRSSEAHICLAGVYERMGDTQRAVRECREAIRIDPDYAKAYSRLGYLYGSMGRLDEAVAQIKRAIELEPGDAEAHSNLGVAYVAMGRPDMAVEQYLEAIRLKPDDAVVHSNLGVAYMKMGSKDQAVFQFEQALALDPGDTFSREKLEELRGAGGG